MFAKRLGHWARSESGASAVEFALVLPIFVAVMIAILQFGWAQHRLSSIRFAMEGASRELLLDRNLSQAQLTTLVRARLTGIGDPNVSITLAVTNAGGGQVAKLTGGYASEIGVPGLAAIPINWTTSVSTALPAA